MGELLANFDKNILILRKKSVFFSKFSYDFCVSAWIMCLYPLHLSTRFHLQ